MSQQRILVTAYSCEPGQGSEPGVGWNWVRQMAQRFDVTLITRENNVDAIERAAREEHLNLEVHGFDLPRWARFWKRGSRGAIPYYYLWQLGLISLARRLDRANAFDLCHHLTFVSSVLPSGLSFLGRPFVWGPIGRHPQVPKAFLTKKAPFARAAEWIRSIGKVLLARLDPLRARTASRADLILSLAPEGQDDIAERHQDRIHSEIAIGVDCSRFAGPRPRRGDFEIVFSGRLVDLKGARLSLEAFALLVENRSCRATLRFVGDGPLLPQLRKRAAELGVSDCVEFAGRLTPSEALDAIEKAHVLLFPSFEGAGMVVLEAMAAGAVVCCLDRGGPAFMVGKDRGLSVPCMDHDFRSTAVALGEALQRLERDEAFRLLLAQRAREWVSSQQDWDRKGERLGALYEIALETHARRIA